MRRHKEKLTIGFDMDGILANLHAAWLNWYNEKWKDDLPLSKLQWDLKAIVKKECGDHVYDYLKDPNIYLKVQPIDGAVDGVKEIMAMGHDVVVVTHPAGGSETVPDKRNWLAKYLPEIKDDNIIFCSKKEIIKLDVFVDDSPNNIVKYRKAWPKSSILTIAWPYNKDVEELVDLRAQSYKKTDKAWDRIVEYIEDL